MFGSLREFRKFKQLSQEEFGRKIGLAEKWKNYPNWETGRSPCPQSIQDKIRKLGFDGPFPQDVVQEERPSYDPTIQNDIIEIRAALKAHIGYWERGEEKVLRRLEDAHQRISQLEKQVSDLQKQVSK